MPIDVRCATFVTRLHLLFQVQQMKYKDSRIKLMNQILAGIKVRRMHISFLCQLVTRVHSNCAAF